MVAVANNERKQCPTCWEEIKTRQYKQILSWDNEKPIHERDFFKLFCILTDSEYTGFADTAEIEVTIWNAVSWFVGQQFFFSDQVPAVLELNGKICEVPKNLGLLTIGQNIIMRQILEGAKILQDKDGKIIDYDCYAEAVAVYMQPIYDGCKFDYAKAKELTKVIDEMPVYLIRPIGFFLLNHVVKSGNRQKKSWPLTLISRISMSVKRLRVWPGLRYYRSGISFIILAGIAACLREIRTMYFLTQVLTR